ncbi:MAG: phosphoribosylformylglycinamidine synthase subunit PurQ [Clostridia bacterium]|nr:phosphoribosylformylglycinamidine synthase subunit PurQ [Clostridia bacterium]
MRVGVVVFPGSNCDRDVLYACEALDGCRASFVWHQERDLKGFDAVVLPGGFSYGDYLRPGAIARFAPAVEATAEFAERGGLVLGICNGFQILCEAGLLPGALRRNEGRRFVCAPVFLRVENPATPFTRLYRPGEVVTMPIAHGQGNYYAEPEVLAALEAGGQVVFRYCDASGAAVPEANPNGSVHNIAGICNRRGNVLGMMPHPERAADPLLGGTDGLRLFQSMQLAAQVLEVRR